MIHNNLSNSVWMCFIFIFFILYFSVIQKYKQFFSFIIYIICLLFFIFFCFHFEQSSIIDIIFLIIYYHFVTIVISTFISTLISTHNEKHRTILKFKSRICNDETVWRRAAPIKPFLIHFSLYRQHNSLCLIKCFAF